MSRSKKRVSHAKEAFYVICIVTVLLIGLFSYLGPGGYREMKKIQAELATRQARIDSLQKSSQEHQKTIDGLGDARKDNAAIEAIARKKGYGKGDEIVQEVAPPQKNSSQTRK